MPLALAARWHGEAVPKGPWFHPRPDALEYAASAQALAQSGRLYLQIGPLQLRPRYPPGWPLLLVPALKAGVSGESLWRVTGLFGAALAWLLAWLTTRATKTIAGSERAALAAGILAGSLWALAPIAVGVGQTVLSDEPAAFVSIAGLTLAGAGFLQGGRRGALVALAGGLAFGLAASMRPVVAVLMAPPLAVFLLGSFRRFGLRPTLGRSAAWGLGAAVFPAVTVLILLRSGLPAWEWSGYDFWVPQRYARLTDTFSLHHALQPDANFRLAASGRPLSHLGIAARVLLGLPGLRIHHYLGLFWPIAGWLAAISLLRLGRRRTDVTKIVAAALLVWTAAHVVLYSLYFYPSSRFYLAPLALCAVLFATACGVAFARPELRFRLSALAAAALVLVLTLQGRREMRRDPGPPPRGLDTRERFSTWIALRDRQRRQRPMPFDPVQAQALGLLPPEVASGIRVWGRLPDTVHVRRLRQKEGLPAVRYNRPRRKE